MIIHISNIRPDETIEIRVKDGSILTPSAELVDIRIKKGREGSLSAAPKSPDGGPRHRRAVCF
jgi:hypothetical protein